MPIKPTTIEGTKTRRPHAHAAKTLAQLHEDRRTEQRRIARELYGDLLPDIEFLQRKFPVNREGPLIRVAGRLRTEEEVREIAARERRLEQPEPAMLAAIVPSRVRRQPASAGSSPAPKVLQSPLPEPAAERLARTLVCEECGEPRSDHRSPICRRCYLEKDRPSRLVPEKRDRLRAAIAEGDGIREAARKAGVSISTAFQHAEKETPLALRCGCGRPNTHQGRCWARRGGTSPIDKLVNEIEALGKRMAAIERRLGIQTSA